VFFCTRACLIEASSDVDPSLRLLLPHWLEVYVDGYWITSLAQYHFTPLSSTHTLLTPTLLGHPHPVYTFETVVTTHNCLSSVTTFSPFDAPLLHSTRCLPPQHLLRGMRPGRDIMSQLILPLLPSSFRISHTNSDNNSFPLKNQTYCHHLPQLNLIHLLCFKLRLPFVATHTRLIPLPRPSLLLSTPTTPSSSHHLKCLPIRIPLRHLRLTGSAARSWETALSWGESALLIAFLSSIILLPHLGVDRRHGRGRRFRRSPHGFIVSLKHCDLLELPLTTPSAPVPPPQPRVLDSSRLIKITRTIISRLTHLWSLPPANNNTLVLLFVLLSPIMQSSRSLILDE